jgi:hypothetical protein
MKSNLFIDSKESQTIKEIVLRFHSLAEDLDDNSDFEGSASDFLVSIYRHNQNLAKQAIQSIIIDIDNRSRSISAIIQVLLAITNPDIDKLCFELSIKRSCPSIARIFIQSYLLYQNFDKAINRIDKTIRKGCHSFLQSKIDEFDILTLVRQACIFKRKHLCEDILTMLRIIQDEGKTAPYIHISHRKSIEVIANGMLQGEDYLKSILLDSCSQIYERQSALFSLGCERLPLLFNFLNQIFQNYYKDSNKTMACNEAIGAIVYCATDEDITRFLVENLEILRNDIQKERRLFSFLPGHHFYVAMRLLKACILYAFRN